LDERGRLLDSPQLSGVLKEQLDQSRKVAIIIGGAYGVTDEVRQKVDAVWSLSPLVYPHQLVRLVLIEQLYRAQQILQGGAYHHE
jgi:23S rRNA (pseudouridine1915-N3)-methyltransferase